MKRLVIIVFFISACLPSLGQSLKLLDTEQNWEGRIGDRIQAPIRIQNISHVPVSIVIERTKTEIGTTQISQICYNGDCLQPEAARISITRKLEPGEITNGFISLLSAGLTEEFSIVSYRVYNRENPLDAVTFDVHYTVKEAVPDDIFYESTEIFLRDVYPNPVSEFAILDYQLKTEDKKAKIVVHNVLGSVIGDYTLSYQENQLKINAQDLNPGVYFYTLYLDSRSISTKKFVVKK